MPSRSASSAPPTSGPSSTTITDSPLVAASIAASRPACPPPITTTSTWRCSTSTRSRARAVLVELPEPGRVAQELLVERPEPPRPDEGLVVEARRRERPAELVGRAHQVAVERAEEVLARDDGARADRLGADAHVRDPVHGHLTVRAVARAALQAARPVVLEAAREDAPAGGEERRAERVALEALDRLAVEGERHRLRAVDPLVRLRPGAAHAGGSGSQVFRTSLRDGVPLGEEPVLAARGRTTTRAGRRPRWRGSRRTR